MERVAIESDSVAAYIRAPERQATSIMQRGTARQRSVVAIACPNEQEEVWSLLQPGEDIVIRAGDTVFISTCPAAVGTLRYDEEE